MGPVPLDQETSCFPPEMQFRGEWRSYQDRLLQQLPSYLQDNRIHIVAAPGSGKTVLGLEIVRRIGHRALILAPTITIRDQWAQRVLDHFLPPDSTEPDWLST